MLAKSVQYFFNAYISIFKQNDIMLSCSLKCFFFSYLVCIKEHFPISLSNVLTTPFIMPAQFMPLYRYILYESSPKWSSIIRFKFRLFPILNFFLCVCLSLLSLSTIPLQVTECPNTSGLNNRGF